MTYQTQSNAYIAYKVQSALGSQASGGGGTLLRTTGGQGGRLTKAAVASREARRDGMRTRGRHGTQKVAGQWSGEASKGSHEAVIEAIVRDTWSSADVQKTQADYTSITTGANTIILASGDPRTFWSAGDVVRLTNQATSTGNNSRNLRITGLSATTITVAETLTVNGTPDASFELTRPGKKLIQFAGASLLKRYFTIDEYDVDMDLSEVFTDFVFGSFKFSMQPDGLLLADVSGIGTGQFAAQATGTSPLLTSPSESTAPPFSVVDATIRVGANDIVDLTGFDISGDISPMAPAVFGSGAIKYSPDVFTGQMAIGLNLSFLRKDLSFITDFAAETPYTLHVLCVENESEPKDFFSIFVPNFTLGGVAKSAIGQAGGPRTVTISVPPDLVGKDQTGTGFDATMIKFQSTGA